MIVQKGVRFSDTLAGAMVPSTQAHWGVPSFDTHGKNTTGSASGSGNGSFMGTGTGSAWTKVPPPPPPRQVRPMPPPTFLGNTSEGEFNQPVVVSEVSSVTPKGSPPKVINAGGDRRCNGFSATQSSVAGILSPISAITEATEAGQSWRKRMHENRVDETIEERCSPEEHESAHLSTSFQTLYTIDMLNFDFINTCKCAKDLGKVIRVLAEKSGSPQLLEAARKRLQVVQAATLKAPPPPPPPRREVLVLTEDPKINQKDEIKPSIPNDTEEEVSPTKIFSDNTANISRITLGNATLDSIDMSYSPPSVLRGLSLIDTPNQSRRSQVSRLSTILEPTSSRRVVPSGDAAHIFREKLLVEEVKRLSMDAADMEAAYASERSNFLERLGALQEAKQQVESLLKTLEKEVEVVSSEKEEAVIAMEKIQREQQTMQEELVRERCRLEAQDRDARMVEERMQGKISELQSALKEEVARCKLVVGAEKSIRLQRESDLELQMERNVELNRLLRQTKEHLERIKRNQDAFRKDLLQAIGESGVELKDISYTDFFVQVVKQVQDMRAENDRLSEELGKADSKPNQMEEECDRRLRKRIDEAMSMNKELEEENVRLGSKIEVLSAEVTSCRALIDKLLKTSHETQASDWEKKEAQYKAAIRNYQQRIRKQTTGISLELYRAVVDDSKRTQAQLQDAERKIIDLETKVSTLQNDGHITEAAKTPNPRKYYQSRNSLLSPTDYLEKGLLSMVNQEGWHRSSPHRGTKIFSSATKPKTPVSEFKTGLYVETKMTDKTKTPARKSKTDKRGYRSPFENFHVTRIVPSPLSTTIPSPGTIEQSKDLGRLHSANHDVLMGMTISFENPSPGFSTPKEVLSPWPIREVPFFGDSNEWGDRYAEKALSSVEKMKGGESTTPGGKPHGASPEYNTSTGSKTPISSLCRKGTQTRGPLTSVQTPLSKENQLPTISPKNVSKTFRMQKVRELGGMKGLRSELNRIRSPQSLGKPRRVARVLGDRLVN